MMRVAAFASLLMLAVPSIAETVPEPDSYRMEQYRAPVPNTLTGATVVDIDAAHVLWSTGHAVFIDVLPRAPKPAELPKGTVWREQPRLSIPGAIWLPNVGYGQLAQASAGYFETEMAQATNSDLNAPVVFFCLSECWMSWNAAKRAVTELGYKQVYWFPDGTDGWDNANYPTEVISPVPGFGARD
ncbi:PQQ-dependent catabolism-associated CXXCW motif protein [Yoonia maritima]|uniref:PQQ-dependent catabolism-associated CXXCW motif protein n=1 Tax=Yoonia maritima TaxID=1435347 RepID=UPI000D1006A6|nr:PQQ-dependent catabolism-associated CXXCW motif protein [Yoonia maritima]